jgi:hypothetical protein
MMAMTTSSSIKVNPMRDPSREWLRHGPPTLLASFFIF